ncbi:hypothetical protein Tco_0507464 [Tanacetum coccineum]
MVVVVVVVVVDDVVVVDVAVVVVWTSLDPPWFDLELHLSGDEDLSRDQGARVVTKEGYKVSMEARRLAMQGGEGV